MTDHAETIEQANRRIAELLEELRVVRTERDDYRLAFDRAPLLIWYKDDKNTVLRANEPAAASAGLTPDEVRGRSTFDLYPDEADGYYRDDLEVIRSGRPKLGIVEVLDTPTGKRWVQTDKIPWRSPAGEQGGVLVFVADITDRIQMQQELYRAQRLESLGILAGGIAHDFNNLLHSVYGNVELLRLQLGISLDGASEEEQPTARFVRRALSSIDRARALTQRLLTFAKGGHPGRQPVDLEPLIEDLVALALTGSSIQPELRVEPDLGPCLGDRDQIAQALENLLVNAVQAIGEAEARAEPEARRGTGVCRVTARRCHDPLPSRTGSWIEIVIEDNGGGIPPEHLDRIFDPFFTTKAEGSGLGLASAYSIAQRHGGTLDCWNNAEGGATFRLLLPVAEGVAGAPRASEEEVAPSLAPLRVLLLDDDEAIRQLAASAGPHLGLQLCCVGGLPAALRSCQQAIEAGRPYDVAVIDLTVRGGSGGVDALRALRALQPGLPAVVCSGYSNDPVLARHAEHGFDAALAKPYLLAELRAALIQATSAPGVASR